MRPARQLALLAAIVLVALGLRMVGVADVLPPDGSVALEGADGSYHARRAYYTYARFPAILHEDPLLAYPGGAWVPWPPLWDWLLGALAAAVAGSERGFALVAALASPVVGALTCAALFGAGRAAARGGPPAGAGRGAALGLGAAALFAVLPMGAVYATVGNPDHHAAVALGVTAYAGLSLALCTGGGAAASAGLAAVRVAMAAAWNGSVLVLALGEGALLLAALWNGRTDLLRHQARGAAAAGLVLAGAVLAWGAPPGAAWTATTLSWLHPVLLLAAAALAAASGLAEARRPAAQPAVRLARAAGAAGLLAALAALALPGLAGDLVSGLGFLGATDVWALGNPEQQPLYAFARGHVDATALWGLLAWILPVPALAVGLCRRAVPDPAARGVLALWTAALGGLALLQVRFGNEAAPLLCLAFAVLGAEAAARLPRGRAARDPAGAEGAARGPLRAGRWLPAALLAALVLPGTWAYQAPRLDRDLYFLRGPGRGRDPLLTTGPGSLVRFARAVREVTPEAGGFTDADVRPAYGVLAPPSTGHVLHWEARRATPADNFGPWLDPGRFAAVQRFYASADEDEALALVRELDARYVLTDAALGLRGDTLAARLYRHNGATGPGSPRLERFRLVLEGPRGGRGFPDWGPASRRVPWKLFEVVPGAEVVVSAAPGAPVELRLELETDLGTRFVYFARTRGGADGLARLRIPYATEPGPRVAARGPARLTRGGTSLELSIPEDAVRAGRRIRIGPDAAPRL